MNLRIEPLSRNHNREGFDSGNDELNHYLLTTARQHNQKGISRTFVLIDNENDAEILGFFTLVACEISPDNLPRKFSKKYPSRAPASRLGRLAVAKHRQRQGLGTIMLTDAMDKVLQVAENIGIIGFFVDAKDENAAAFYHRFGFIHLLDNPLELFLPLETIRHALEVE